MPLYIRHLPGSPEKLIDEKTFSKNVVVFNPSIAFPVIYIRKVEHFNTKEENSAVLYNISTRSAHNINMPQNMLMKNVNRFTGVEDMRICWYKNTLWFSGTCTHASENMKSEMVVGYFDKELTRIERMSHIAIGSSGSVVKNVCPFVVGTGSDSKLLLFDILLHSIYELSEKVDDNGAWQKFIATKVRKLVPANGVSIDGYRGSTSPVHLHGNTWGVIVHDIIFNDNSTLVTQLSYIHHWMEFDVETGVVSFVSTPFWVIHWGIEYISGIHIDKNKCNVSLYMGVNDSMAFKFDTTLYDLRCGK
jgi:hypothetical protein